MFYIWSIPGHFHPLSVALQRPWLGRPSLRLSACAHFPRFYTPGRPRLQLHPSSIFGLDFTQCYKIPSDLNTHIDDMTINRMTHVEAMKEHRGCYKYRNVSSNRHQRRSQVVQHITCTQRTAWVAALLETRTRSQHFVVSVHGVLSAYPRIRLGYSWDDEW